MKNLHFTWIMLVMSNARIFFGFLDLVGGLNLKPKISKASTGMSWHPEIPEMFPRPFLSGPQREHIQTMLENLRKIHTNTLENNKNKHFQSKTSRKRLDFPFFSMFLEKNEQIPSLFASKKPPKNQQRTSPPPRGAWRRLPAASSKWPQRGVWGRKNEGCLETLGGEKAYSRELSKQKSQKKLFEGFLRHQCLFFLWHHLVLGHEKLWNELHDYMF